VSLFKLVEIQETFSFYCYQSAMTYIFQMTPEIFDSVDPILQNAKHSSTRADEVPNSCTILQICLGLDIGRYWRCGCITGASITD
jgi:hypothetical protein